MVTAFTCGGCGTRYENLPPLTGYGPRIRHEITCICGGSPAIPKDKPMPEIDPSLIERVATALGNALRGDACPRDTWVSDAADWGDGESTLKIDGDVHLRALARAAIAATLSG